MHYNDNFYILPYESHKALSNTANLSRLERISENMVYPTMTGLFVSKSHKTPPFYYGRFMRISIKSYSSLVLELNCVPPGFYGRFDDSIINKTLSEASGLHPFGTRWRARAYYVKKLLLL